MLSLDLPSNQLSNDGPGPVTGLKSDRASCMFCLDEHGIVTGWPARAAAIVGLAPTQAIGTPFSAYLDDLKADCRAAELIKTARAMGIASCVGRVKIDGAASFEAEVTVEAMSGTAGGTVAFAVSITRELEQVNTPGAEAGALERSISERERLLRLFRQAPGFVCFFHGPEHVYTLQNEAHHKLAGYKDIIGKPVRVALPELADQGFFELLDQVYSSGKAYNGRALPLMIVAPGSDKETLRYIDFIYQPVLDDQGKVEGILSQGNDVTEQVLAQRELGQKQVELERLLIERTEALQATRKALQIAENLTADKMHLVGLFEQAPGFLCVLNGPDHTYELANSAYRTLVGDRELIGRTVVETLPEVVDQGFIALLDRVFVTGEPFVGYGVPVNLQIESNGGPTERFVDFIYQPIRGADGVIKGIFVQGSDVTTKKHALDEVRRYQQTLEAQVRERTDELVEAQTALHRAHRLEAVGKLTGGVAHDFNNILQVIGGNLQLLKDSASADPTVNQRVNAALGAVERGAKLSGQLLAFARRQPLQPVVTSLVNDLRRMDELLRRVLGEAIQIETVLSAGLWNTLVDPNQLENVILNLAINARDAMPQGGKLTLELGNAMLDDGYTASLSDVSPGQYVLLAISDTGSGMTGEVLERACEPFFTTKPEGAGTGLGLSMAYGFVKQSGGHLKIYSEVGVGTTVKLYFPRSLESVVEGKVEVSQQVVGGSETILVVEDDEAVQNTVVQLLGNLGYRVLKANSAESALSILKSGLPIDLLFTDVVMPGTLRSPELARQAKILLPNIQVLFTSGYTQNAIVHGGRLDPGVQLLTKPYPREQLARKLRQLLGNREATPDQGSAPMPGPAPGGARGQRSLRILVVEDNIDAQQMACDVFSVLGHVAEGVGSAPEALERLGASTFDVLFTDFSLPGMDGAEMAMIARRRHPGLRIIFASGYGNSITLPKELNAVVVGKPYDLDTLESLLEND
jgi:signal transduction histidine kinase/DNA-binding response OmpR family regulator